MERLEHLQKELADAKENANTLRAQYEAEKQDISKIRNVREEIEKVRHQIEDAERSYDLNLAAQLRYGTLNKLEAELKAEEQKLQEADGGEAEAAARGGN